MDAATLLPDSTTTTSSSSSFASPVLPSLNPAIKQFGSNVDNYLQQFTSTPVWPYIHLFILLYAAHIAPILPSRWLSILNNVYVRLILLALIVWTSTSNPALALAVSLIVVSAINLANHKGILESFSWEGPLTSIYPGCLNLTVADLVESFGGKQTDLIRAMKMSKIPDDVELTEYYAPIIGTYLIYSGYNIKQPCAFRSDNAEMW